MGSKSYLETENLRLNERERAAVDLDETLTGLEKSKCQHFSLLATFCISCLP